MSLVLAQCWRLWALSHACQAVTEWRSPWQMSAWHSSTDLISSLLIGLHIIYFCISQQQTQNVAPGRQLKYTCGSMLTKHAELFFLFKILNWSIVDLHGVWQGHFAVHLKLAKYVEFKRVPSSPSSAQGSLIYQYFMRKQNSDLLRCQKKKKRKGCGMAKVLSVTVERSAFFSLRIGVHQGFIILWIFNNTPRWEIHH